MKTKEKKKAPGWALKKEDVYDGPEGPEKDEKKPGSDLLSRKAAVPSARGCFTSVFGMGTGVAALLWPPGDHRGTQSWIPDDPSRKTER